MSQRASERPRSLTAVAVLLLLTAAGTAAFWVDWFLAGHVIPEGDACFAAFERAFPLADGIMSVFLVAAAVGLLRLQSSGFRWSMIGVGCLWFLGSLDTLYNLEHGRYGRLAAEPVMRLDAALNVYCYLFGVALFLIVWWRRDALFAAERAGAVRQAALGKRPGQLTALAIVLLTTAVGIVVWWTRWFTHDRALYADNPCLVVFEDTFPLADGIVALIAASSGVGILTRRHWALATTLVVSGGLLFLASMDGLYYIEQQRWVDADGPFMAGLILTLYGLGIWSGHAIWSARTWLLAADAPLADPTATSAPAPSA